MEQSQSRGTGPPRWLVPGSIVFLAGAMVTAALAAEAGAGPGAGAPAPGAPPAAGTVAAPAAVPVQHLEGGAVLVGGITVDPRTRSISFPATLNLAQGVLEVIIATPEGRLHEALLKADISPLRLQALLYTLNLSNGPRQRDTTGRMGDLVDIDLEYTGADGKAVREPVESWIRDTRTGAPMKRLGWVFTGSAMRDGVFLAEEEGNICINYSVGSAIFDSPDSQSLDDTIHVVEPSRREPGLGAPVKVIITPRDKTP